MLAALVGRAPGPGGQPGFCLTFETEFFAAFGFQEFNERGVETRVYEELLQSVDEGSRSSWTWIGSGPTPWATPGWSWNSRPYLLRAGGAPRLPGHPQRSSGTSQGGDGQHRSGALPVRQVGGGADAGDVETFDGDDPPGTAGEDQLAGVSRSTPSPLSGPAAMAAACSKSPASIGGNAWSARRALVRMAVAFGDWFTSRMTARRTDEGQQDQHAQHTHQVRRSGRNLHGGLGLFASTESVPGRSASGQGAFRCNDGSSGFRGVERGRPLLGAVLPVEQRLVHPDRLDRADPLGIVDQQLTVGQHRVVDGMPVTAQRGQWLADAPATRASTAHRHPGGRSGGGETLGGPDVMATAHSGAYVPFLPSDGGRSGAEVRPVAPCDGEAGPNRWSAVVSRKARGHHRHRPPIRATCVVNHRLGGSPSPRRGDPGITAGPRPRTHTVRAGRRRVPGRHRRTPEHRQIQSNPKHRNDARHAYQGTVSRCPGVAVTRSHSRKVSVTSSRAARWTCSRCSALTQLSA